MADQVLEQFTQMLRANGDMDAEETSEWLEALDGVIRHRGEDRARYLMTQLLQRLYSRGHELPFFPNTPYINTIPVEDEPEYPGDKDIEKRISRLLRWNATAMVVRANVNYPGIGGHISSYASAAMLYEVGFNHFFRGKGDGFDGDLVYIQGHASPGICLLYTSPSPRDS